MREEEREATGSEGEGEVRLRRRGRRESDAAEWREEQDISSAEQELIGGLRVS